MSFKSASRRRGMAGTDIKEAVKAKYGQTALRVKSGRASCCDTDELGCNPITSDLYNASQVQQIPEEALLASLGCGNPTALAKLNPGAVCLDPGLGRGTEVLVSRLRVAP